jgi:hypothetical protein
VCKTWGCKNLVGESIWHKFAGCRHSNRFFTSRVGEAFLAPLQTGLADFPLIFIPPMKFWGDSCRDVIIDYNERSEDMLGKNVKTFNMKLTDVNIKDKAVMIEQ